MAPAPVGDDLYDGDTEVEDNNSPPQPAEKEKVAGTKHKTKTQVERDNNMEKILKLAQAEDHPVELALTAIAKQMMRTLTADEQDELLDELQAVSSRYFRERRKKNHDTQPAVSVVRAVPTPPPPPLTPAGQPVQPIQHADINQMENEVLVELPPMNQYSNTVQYVSTETGTTYMQLQ